MPSPTTLIGAGDTILVADWGLRRVTAWTEAGKQLAAWPMPDGLRGALPRARDAAGQWYFQIDPDPKDDGSGLLDSAAVVRSDPQLTRFDTLARLAPPDLAITQGMNGNRYQRRALVRVRSLGRRAGRHAVGGARLPESDRVVSARGRQGRSGPSRFPTGCCR